MQIKEFLEKYWKHKQIKKWDYLFRQWSEDDSLYYILDWELLLKIWNQDIALVWKDELLWEKSFLKDHTKPIDWIAKTDLEFLSLSYKDFSKLDINIQLKFVTELTLFVSNRVYLLNDIISSLSFINTKVIQDEPALDLSYLNEVFNFIDLKNIYIYKKDWDLLLPIYESKLDFSLQESINSCQIEEIWIKQEEDRIFVKINEFIIVLEWKKTKWEYIINNILMHSVWTLKYLCYVLEEKKNNNLNDLLD